jgi:hypothetical protein
MYSKCTYGRFTEYSRLSKYGKKFRQRIDLIGLRLKRIVFLAIQRIILREA